ncbi:hypothetical protein RFI_29689, partial [Reticulomyxa filosa]
MKQIIKNAVELGKSAVELGKSAVELGKCAVREIEKTEIGKTAVREIEKTAAQELRKIVQKCSNNPKNIISDKDMKQFIAYFSKIHNQKNESEILREMCLQILWNLLNYPKETKYRQISRRNLYNNLKRKCSRLKVSEKIILEKMEYLLKRFGFQKGNDENWYYQKDVEIISLWGYYNEWANGQPMYYLYETKLPIPKTVDILDGEQWKEYEIVLDYKYRRIVLRENAGLNIRSLQIGNPKRSSLEFGVDIQWYN